MMLFWKNLAPKSFFEKTLKIYLLHQFKGYLIEILTQGTQNNLEKTLRSRFLIFGILGILWRILGPKLTPKNGFCPPRNPDFENDITRKLMGIFQFRKN